MNQPGLTPVQIEVARIFFGLDEPRGYVVDGGAALLASDLIARGTEAPDLFTSPPTDHVTPASAALRRTHKRGYAVTTVQESVTFCRLLISRDDNEVLVDLGIDSPPLTPPT